MFRAIFERAQRAKVLKGFELWDNTYGLAVDGTGYFSSDSVHCENCLEKNSAAAMRELFIIKCWLVRLCIRIKGA